MSCAPGSCAFVQCHSSFGWFMVSTNTRPSIYKENTHLYISHCSTLSPTLCTVVCHCDRPHTPCHRRGPTLDDVLDDSDFELQPLPSDEAWFGEPDPSIYAAGTNDLTKEQLAQEVAKGNVCTLRQLKSHLLTATEDELAVSSTDPASLACFAPGGARGCNIAPVGTWQVAAPRTSREQPWQNRLGLSSSHGPW